MKIQAFPFLYKQNTPQKVVTNDAPKLKQPLCSDTISFGYLDEDAYQGMQVYRSISERELKALMKDKFVQCQGYLTSDPRGWRSYDWASGYVHSGSENVYFVTFKKNRLKIASRRDDERDTRYGIRGNGYSLDDVANIREGNNSHGKLVYAEDLEKAKKEDLELKKSEINRLKKFIFNSRDNEEKLSAWDELSSYTKEFPQIVNEMKQIMALDNETNVAGLSILISKTKSTEQLQLLRNCFETQIKNDFRLAKNAVNFYIKNAQKSDFPLVMKLIDNKKISGHAGGLLLANVSDDNDYEKVVDHLKNDDLFNLTILSVCYARKNKDGKYTNLFREILEKDLKTPKGDLDKYDFSELVETCAQEIGEHGNKNDIKILEKYLDKENPNNYPSLEVSDQIKKLDEIKD